MNNITQLKEELMASVEGAKELQELDEVRVSALGKKGKITALMKTLGSLAPEERKEAGKGLNILKGEVAKAIEAKKEALEEKELDEKLKQETIDVTLSTRQQDMGRIHPTSQVYEEVVAIFSQMGFEVAEGPDIEDCFHNFTALNMPENHPARQMHDTFYFPVEEGVNESENHVLRTHTSPVQIRTMENKKPPIKIIAPGRTYRCDSDITHTPMFHQVEGLVIDKKSNMADLKGCIIEFCEAFFEIEDVPVQFRPSFFPFTEPSAEMDIGCTRKDGDLKIGHGADWLEILGCGMVNPNVLKHCGIDPDEYQGYAFGLGLERIAMLKYGIPDLRTFFDSDLRWLKHYGFLPLDMPSMTGGLSMMGGAAK